MKGELKGKTWLRRPELESVLTKEHATVEGISFTIGVDEDGHADLKSVTYPDHWSEEQILQAIEHREEVMATEGCKHCRAVEEDTSIRARIKRARKRLLGRDID